MSPASPISSHDVLLLFLLAQSILLRSCTGVGFTSSAYNSWLDKVRANGDYTGAKFLYGSGKVDQTTNTPKPAVALHWRILDQEAKLRLAIAVESPKVRWLGLGLAEMGGMPGADIVVFESQARQKVQDLYATAFARPLVDPQQDWVLTNSIVEDDMILFEVERPLDTDDPMDWPILPDEDPLLPGTKLLAAWGETDEMHYHGRDNRLQATVRFYGEDNIATFGVPNGSSSSAVDDKAADKAFFNSKMSQLGEGSITFKMNNYNIPARWPSFYAFECFTVKDLARSQGLPIDKPLHLIGFEWLLDPGDHVHHIALYSSPDETYQKCDETGPHSFMHVWNKGQDVNYFLPENVGMLLADETNHGGLGRVPKSFRLELHYESPPNTAVPRDSSGVRIHYTSKLREHTGAIVEFGDPRVKLMHKPIGQNLQKHTFSCPDSCFKNHVGPNGLHVLYEMLHMHRHGLVMQNVHSRNGKEIRRSTVQYYDFDQGAQIVKQAPFKILPGDSFETHCMYDGGNNTKAPVKFGFEADKEMCMGWVMIYPAADVHLSCSYMSEETGCAAEYKSYPLESESQLERSFGIPKPSDISKAKASTIPSKVSSSSSTEMADATEATTQTALSTPMVKAAASSSQQEAVLASSPILPDTEAMVADEVGGTKTEGGAPLQTKEDVKQLIPNVVPIETGKSVSKKTTKDEDENEMFVVFAVLAVAAGVALLVRKQYGQDYKKVASLQENGKDEEADNDSLNCPVVGGRHTTSSTIRRR